MADFIPDSFWVANKMYKNANEPNTQEEVYNWRWIAWNVQLLDDDLIFQLIFRNFLVQHITQGEKNGRTICMHAWSHTVIIAAVATANQPTNQAICDI